jgi:hypothetical protein
LWNYTTAAISWGTRFLAISLGLNATRFSSTGFFEIAMPPEGTVIPGVGTAGATVAGGYIPLASFRALYYILPLGAASTSVPANFRIVAYGVTQDIPAHWILVAQQNADDNSVRWGTGEHTAAAPGTSVSDRKRGVITGSGTPEGALSAPVGSEYTDQAATAGAVKWMKYSGSGNTGWRVVSGDTDWRDLTVAAYAVNAWTWTHLRLRRTNDLVEVYYAALNGSAATGDAILTIPLGFRTGSTGTRYFETLTNTAVADPNHGLELLSGGALQVRFNAPGTRANTLQYGGFSYTTRDPWPATLPGSIAP